MTDHRALLASIGHRMVKNVAAEISAYANALYAVMCERKPIGAAWPHDEWLAMLNEMETSTLSVAEFLRAEHSRAKR